VPRKVVLRSKDHAIEVTDKEKEPVLGRLMAEESCGEVRGQTGGFKGVDGSLLDAKL
jgi:hypothetical protein